MGREEIKFTKWSKDPAIFYRDIFNEEPYRYQSKVLRELLNLNLERIMIMAAGGTGKSKMLACYGLWSTTILPKIINRPYECIIVAGSKPQGKHVYSYSRRGLLDTPSLSKLIDGDSLISETHFKDRSILRVLARSPFDVQGKHGDCEIIDEAGFPELDWVIKDSDRVLSTATNPRLILSSTPHEYSSLMVEMWLDENTYSNYNIKTNTGWNRYSWSALDCPRVTKERIEQWKKKGEDIFTIYALGKPYQRVGTLIPIDLIKNSSKDIPILIHDPSGGIVIAGIDWGWQHPTALIIVQIVNGIYKILYNDQYRREQFSNIQDKIEAICKEYKVSYIYTDAEDKGENQRLLERGLPVFPIAFNKEKTRMQARMLSVFTNGNIRIPEDYMRLKNELIRYTWNTKENDDNVDALMLALREIPEDSSTDIYYKIIKPKRRNIYL